MKVSSLLYYAIQWISWSAALLLFTKTDLPIKNMTVKVVVLVFMAIYLSWIGYRDFVKQQ